MNNPRTKVLIKLKGEAEVIDAKIDTSDLKHGVDNWLMGRRPMKLYIKDPTLQGSERSYSMDCKLGPELGQGARIMFAG